MRWSVPERRQLVALLAGVGVLVALVATGTVDGARDAFVFMGFDPDRGSLLAAFVVAAAAAAVVGLLADARTASMLLGVVAVAVAFGPVFVAETRAALGSSGAAGVFSPGGWAMTVLALGVAGAATGWAANVLATEVRRLAAGAWEPALAAVRRGVRAPRPYRGLAGAAGVALLVLVTVSVLGDMLNYTPDAEMRQGGPPPAPLVGSAGASVDTPVATDAPTARSASSGSATVPAPSASYSGGVSTSRPWLAWVPTGQGRIAQLTLPAPWVGGAPTLTLDVYLPPGYDAGTRHYPVIYEVPWTYHSWSAIHIATMLDTLIDGGQIPAAIVVFVAQLGDPYVHSECADSYDGREHFDTFVSTSVVTAIDAKYRTIPQPAARTLLGFSEGGYCAASLLLRHPAVFGSAVSFDGYYVAGLVSNQTVNAALPFGGNPALLAAYSPIKVAPRVDPTLRPRLFLVIAGDPAEGLYGPQMTSFLAALQAAGIPHATIADPIGHSWIEVRRLLPAALEAVGARQAALGVLS